MIEDRPSIENDGNFTTNTDFIAYSIHSSSQTGSFHHDLWKLKSNWSCFIIIYHFSFNNHLQN